MPFKLRNPDEDIRKLERNYLESGNPLDGQLWAQILNRAGLIQRLDTSLVDLDWETFSQQATYWLRMQSLLEGNGEPPRFRYWIEMTLTNSRIINTAYNLWTQALSMALSNGLLDSPSLVLANMSDAVGRHLAIIGGMKAVYIFLCALAINIQESEQIVHNFTPIPDPQHDRLLESRIFREEVIALRAKMLRDLGFIPSIF